MRRWPRPVGIEISRTRGKWVLGLVTLVVLLLVFQMYQRPDFLVMMSQLIWACF